MKVEKNEFLIEGRKSAMTTMRRRPLADCSRLELPATGKARLPTVDSVMGDVTRQLTAELANWIAHLVHLMNAQHYHVAHDSETEVTELSCKSACKLLSSTPTVAVYCLVLIRLKAHTYSTIPWRVESCTICIETAATYLTQSHTLLHSK